MIICLILYKVKYKDHFPSSLRMHVIAIIIIDIKYPVTKTIAKINYMDYLIALSLLILA
jgi:hypothetical protein